MQIVIDISKDRYNEIMAMDWVNGRRFFDEELRAIHDGKVLEKQPCDDCVSRQAVLDVLDKSKYSNEFCEEHHIDWSINLGMAHIVVNELKPVTLQPCDDAVSRQAVLEVIRKCHCEEWVKADIGAPIEALQSVTPQPKMEPCADMVSRDAMWDVLQRLYGTEGELVEELMSLPPVLPMPKMGWWTHDGSHWENRWICSECGYKLFFPQTRFCPNCGAKMSEIPTGSEGSEE